MPYLNNNILAFDSVHSAGALIEALRSRDPDYVVLRQVQREPTAATNFYVFLSEDINAILRQFGIVKRRSSLATLLPQLSYESAAPQLASEHALFRWSDVYSNGPWRCASYPVATAYAHVLGVWEPTENDIDKPPASDSLPTSTPMPTPPRSRLYELKERIDSAYDSMRKASSRKPEPVGLPINMDFLVEALPAEEVDITEDEIDSLLQYHSLFPDIDVSNRHPVIEESIQISVSLKAEKIKDITGAVVIPDVGDKDYIYEIKVHLLCGDESHWDVLEYAQGEGMLKNAEFQLSMPDMPLDQAGNYPERHRLPLRVNFYFQNRWCGEGERYLDLRLTDGVAPLDRIPPPAESEWRKFIRLEPTNEPPDLLVRIAHKPGTNTYHWSCLSPHLVFDETTNALMTLPSSAQDFVNNLFEPFATNKLNRFQQTTLKGIFEEIYDSTPECFKQAYWALKTEEKQAPFEFNSILFISDEPCIPWELMRATDPQQVTEAGILSITHSVGRWLAQSSNHLTQQINVETFVASGSDYVDQRSIPNLPWVTQELEQLTKRYQAESIDLTSDEVLNFLRHGSAQAVHFACHGTMSVKTPFKSELIMEDHPASITPPNISAYEVEIGLGAHHPMIFLNACQSGSTGTSLSLVSGFPAAFLKAGASAVICPLWTVDDEQANVIATIFYEAAFEQSGITLGEIMQRIHQRWETEQHLTYLAYVLYGDPQTRVIFQPKSRQQKQLNQQTIEKASEL